MRALAAAGAVLTCAALVAGCGSKTPDYQSVWTNSGSAAATLEAPVPIGTYLEQQHVTAEEVAPNTLSDLTVSMPTPKGWSRVENPKLPPRTVVIGKGDKFPRAILTVLKLTGDFDAAEAIKHGIADTELAQNFKRLDASDDDFQGFPSGMVQGSHDVQGQRLHSWFRMVVATGGPPSNERYLVQLTIVTLADQAAAQAADAETIMNGFTVAAK